MMRALKALRWLGERLGELGIDLKKRFTGVTRSEKNGYVVWSLTGLVILVPEVKAVGQDCNFSWPTISTTVGYLQFQWPVVALIPVALIVTSTYFVVRFEFSKPPQIEEATRGWQLVQAFETTDDYLIVRTPEGRRAKVEFSSYEQLAPSGLAGGNALVGTTRAPWRARYYFGLAFLVVGVGWAFAIQLPDRYVTGYVLYGLIAVFWVIVPNVAARWWRKDVQFTTLVYTIGILGRRLPIVAALTVGLLMILLLHLALYPWPSTPASFCWDPETTSVQPGSGP